MTKVIKITSRRFCMACEKITTFEYNKNIGHSECRECGGFKAMNPNSDNYKMFKMVRK